MTTIFEPEETSTVTFKRFCVDDFHKMMEIGVLIEESGWEIIDGKIIDKIKISSKNAGTVTKINKVLANLVGHQVLISIRSPIHIDDYNEPEPDIALLKPREDFYAESHPLPPDVLLLIEVSDSTLGFDREIKRTLYAEAGILEFWLVNLTENTIECYSSPKNGSYRLVKIVGAGEIAASVTIENLTLEVDEILA